MIARAEGHRQPGRAQAILEQIRADLWQLVLARNAYPSPTWEFRESEEQWREREPFPDPHALDRFVAWYLSGWADARLEDLDPLTPDGEDLLALADAFSVPHLDDEADELEAAAEFISEFQDKVSAPLVSELLADTRFLNEFSEFCVALLDDVETGEASVVIPAWALSLVREKAHGKCSECGKPLVGGGQIRYRVDPAQGGWRDVTNLAVVCEQCT